MKGKFIKKNISEKLYHVQLLKENTDCSCAEAYNICPSTTNKCARAID